MLILIHEYSLYNFASFKFIHIKFIYVSDHIYFCVYLSSFISVKKPVQFFNFETLLQGTQVITVHVTPPEKAVMLFSRVS